MLYNVYMLRICTCNVDCYEVMGLFFGSLILSITHPNSFTFIFSFSSFSCAVSLHSILYFLHSFYLRLMKSQIVYESKKTNNNLLLWIIHLVGVKYRDHLRLFKFVSTQRIAFLLFSFVVVHSLAHSLFHSTFLSNWIRFACFVFFSSSSSPTHSNWLFRLFEFGLNFFFLA